MSYHKIEQNILDLHQSGYSIRQIASTLAVTKYTVEKILKATHQTLSGLNSQTVSGSMSEYEETASEVPTDTVFRRNRPDTSSRTQEIQRDNAIEEYIKYESRTKLYRAYQEFLHEIKSFLTKDQLSENLAIHSFKNMKDKVESFANYARSLCAFCQADYKSLFIFYLIDNLNNYFQQTPQLVMADKQIKIKENTSIQLLLNTASSSDVLALR
jgi:transposase